ncbi:TetR/AcrR family transcriptional regulator [Leptolyngbyaceae cyanobacterium CCMR0081]|uniref:TetR/AcrR family transcriptional regulator n=1 Tax=Adonisia turfae CCMR0081 TaxID=2292702 RepID=A0A6M0RRJ1_9CYAN|nr:TetR/AcrR family transcriptional regulator [Adonisia turfae]NEZ58729.1 TetR/AcrR family transcriptional regulator [Adonisia turfae CCMR0081]
MYSGKNPLSANPVVKSSAKSKRSSAKRQSRDPEATKAKILDAAEEEFARHGLAGARTEPIAANIGFTKAMIHYYFGTKEELYQAVLERYAATFLVAVETLNLENLSPPDVLRTFLRAAVAHEVNNPYQGKVLLHEAMGNEGRYFKLTGWEVPINLGVSFLRKGMDEGYFRPLDPWLTMIHIMGTMTFYFNAENNLRNLVPESEWRAPQAIEAYAESAIAFILAGVLKHSQANG